MKQVTFSVQQKTPILGISPYKDKVICIREFKRDFPALGSTEVLYVESSTDDIYLWDKDNHCYRILVSNYIHIQNINGGQP